MCPLDPLRARCVRINGKPTGGVKERECTLSEQEILELQEEDNECEASFETDPGGDQGDLSAHAQDASAAYTEARNIVLAEATSRIC